MPPLQRHKWRGCRRRTPGGCGSSCGFRAPRCRRRAPATASRSLRPRPPPPSILRHRAVPAGPPRRTARELLRTHPAGTARRRDCRPRRYHAVTAASEPAGDGAPDPGARPRYDYGPRARRAQPGLGLVDFTFLLVDSSLIPPGSRHPVLLSLSGPQGHAVAGDVVVGSQRSVARFAHPVEEQRVEAVMVVEILDVADVGHGDRNGSVQVGGAVGRNVQMAGLGQ